MGRNKKIPNDKNETLVWTGLEDFAVVTLRKPENSSIARVMTFNKPYIAIFSRHTKKSLTNINWARKESTKSMKVDSTVQNAPKIFDSTGKKQVGTIAGSYYSCLLHKVILPRHLLSQGKIGSWDD